MSSRDDAGVATREPALRESIERRRDAHADGRQLDIISATNAEAALAQERFTNGVDTPISYSAIVPLSRLTMSKGKTTEGSGRTPCASRPS